MPAFFRVTYDVVSPESAEHGDTCDNGFAAPGGWKFPVDDPGPHEMTLREAIETCGFYPRAKGISGFENCGRWFSTIDPDQNYQTGEDTRYAIHPPRNITASSYKRLSRYLTGK
jgi:hypothetical protein